MKKSLLFRAARLFEQKKKDHDQGRSHLQVAARDRPENDDVAQSGYEEALRQQEKYEELVEHLLEISESSESHTERARALNKIGHLYAGELEDTEQAVFAFAQALAQDVQNEEYASDLEKARGRQHAATGPRRCRRSTR